MTAESLAAPRPQGQSRLALYLGLSLGIVAAVIVAVVMSSGSGQERVVPATRVAMVAAQDIPARSRITSNMLKAEFFELKDVDSEAFAASSQLTNRVTAVDIKAGQIIVPSLVSETAGSGLTFTITPGKRALAIGVREVVTAGGNIVPGNYVDVIAEFDVKAGADLPQMIAALFGEQPPPGPPIVAGLPSLAGGADRKMIMTMLQNMKVIAVAQELPSTRAATNTANGTTAAVPAAQNPNPRAATVTLEVTPQQAQILVLADQNATLRLTVRPFSEDAQVPLPPFIIAVE